MILIFPATCVNILMETFYSRLEIIKDSKNVHYEKIDSLRKQTYGNKQIACIFI